MQNCQAFFQDFLQSFAPIFVQNIDFIGGQLSMFQGHIPRAPVGADSIRPQTSGREVFVEWYHVGCRFICPATLLRKRAGGFYPPLQSM